MFSGLQVNFSKSEIYSIHLNREQGTLPKSVLSLNGPRLGISFPVDLKDLTEAIFDPIFKSVHSSLKQWDKLVLSWPDILQLIKSFVFPRFLFFFAD